MLAVVQSSKPRRPRLLGVPCGIGECGRPATRETDLGPLCEAHRKRLHPSRSGGKALLEPVESTRPISEQVKEVALAYANAESDADYAQAEADIDALALAMETARRERERMRQTLKRYGPEVVSKRISHGMEMAKSRGVRLGRPPVLDGEAARHAIKLTYSIRKAAEALEVDEKTVRRALQRAGITSGAKGFIKPHGDVHALRPHDDGGSDES